MGEVLHGSLLPLLLEHCDFLNIDISQGSVATYLKCGGIVKYEFVANLPVSLPVKEFWKSVNIWGSYGQEFSVLFFWDTVYYATKPALTLQNTFHLQGRHVSTLRKCVHSTAIKLFTLIVQYYCCITAPVTRTQNYPQISQNSQNYTFQLTQSFA